MDPLLIAQNAQVTFQRGESSFLLPFLNRTCRVEHPSGIIYNSDGSRVSQYLSIIMLHYLAIADGTPLSNRLVSFRHLPGGDIYMAPFQGRAVTPFLKTFGSRPEDFERGALALGGYRGEGSGTSMVVPVMPRVPLCFVIWAGDEEFSPSATILFDQAASSYLSTEDYAHLPAIITAEMKALI